LRYQGVPRDSFTEVSCFRTELYACLTARDDARRPAPQPVHPKPPGPAPAEYVLPHFPAHEAREAHEPAPVVSAA
jgi:hypothetical protein